MTDFTREDMTGSRFEEVNLTDARFRDVDLTNARFHLVNMTGVMIRGAAMVNVNVSGEIENLRVNGVDVVPLVEAELNRRYPDRDKMCPTDADGFREAWDILERLWQWTVERARAMDQRCCTSGPRESGPSSRRCAISSSRRTPG
ncbi:MAG: pentapeptide repeat-containing protein [Nocardioides sp.]